METDTDDVLNRHIAEHMADAEAALERMDMGIELDDRRRLVTPEPVA